MASNSTPATTKNPEAKHPDSTEANGKEAGSGDVSEQTEQSRSSTNTERVALTLQLPEGMVRKLRMVALWKDAQVHALVEQYLTGPVRRDFKKFLEQMAEEQ